MEEPRPEPPVEPRPQEPREEPPEGARRSPSEAERAGKAVLLGAIVGFVLALLAGRRSADPRGR